MKQKLPVLVAALFAIGCSRLTFVPHPVPDTVREATQALSPVPTQTETATASQTFLPTDIPTASPTPEATDTSTPIPASQWYVQGPGEVVVPILLYHHIDISPSDNFYYLSPDEFEKQMYLLHAWGYTTISVELLARAIETGAALPPRPVILTFDDGTISTFTNAFPIIQKYNFTGISYVVYNYIGGVNYMSADQIRTLAAAGWEVGSHSLSHVDLTKNPDRERDEIVESRKRLQSLLDLPILSFAYPFGLSDRSSVDYVRFAGYRAAMGLGNGSLQSNRNLFYLRRMEVNRSMDLTAFASLLPWREDLSNLPALTLVP